MTAAGATVAGVAALAEVAEAVGATAESVSPPRGSGATTDCGATTATAMSTPLAFVIFFGSGPMLGATTVAVAVAAEIVTTATVPASVPIATAVAAQRRQLEGVPV